MKHLTFALVIIAGVFIAGCSDTNTTAPIVNDEATIRVVQKLQAETGVVELSGLVSSQPYESKESLYDLKAEIGYQIKEMGSFNDLLVEVDLKVDGILFPVYAKAEPIVLSGSSTDIVALNEKGEGSLEKHYVLGDPREVANKFVLRVKLLVNEKTVRVVSVAS